MRKEPSQARAQSTVEALFEATAQVLLSDGYESTTTNKIAARAGVSIGTLYQYFTDKDDIIAARNERGRAIYLAEVDAMLSAAENMQPRQAIEDQMRYFIRYTVHYLTGSSERSKQLAKIGWRFDDSEAAAASVNQVAQRIALAIERSKEPSLRRPTTASVFVLTRAVYGAIRAASLEDSPLAGSPEFEDELVRLSLRLTYK